MARRRILAGGIIQESHSFVDRPTTRADFLIERGHAASASAEGTNTQLGGVLSAAAARDVDVVVPILATAQPGGPVEQEVYEEVADAFAEMARAGTYDAIVFAMHGAMLTPTLQDPEGTLISTLRDIVGEAVPITASFDLHAHVTPKTLSSCDLLAGYLTNPHADLAQTGVRSFRAAMDILDGRLDPVCAAVRVPMLTLGNDRTDAGPLQALHRRAQASVASGAVYDVSIFNAQQFIDVQGLGQWVLVYADSARAGAAETLARSLADELWSNRDGLIGKYPSLDEVLAEQRVDGRPAIVGDQGDRVVAGSVGDSTWIVRELVASGFDGRAVVPICDAAALERCRAAGVGSEISLTFGGRHCRAAPPQTLTGRVEVVADGATRTFHGPYNEGIPAHLGPHAVFTAGTIDIVLTSEPCSFVDPAYYEAAGLLLGGYRLIVARSGYHFTLNYRALGRCLTIETPGPTSYDVGQFPWQHARPFYPLDRRPPAAQQLTVKTFRSSAARARTA